MSPSMEKRRSSATSSELEHQRARKAATESEHLQAAAIRGASFILEGKRRKQCGFCGLGSSSQRT